MTERVDKHDREIAAIWKLVHTGMKMLARMEPEHLVYREEARKDREEARKELREMRAFQQETARQVRALYDTVDRVVRSIEHNEGNGHSKKRIE